MDLLPIVLSFISGLAAGILVLHQLFKPVSEEDVSKPMPHTMRTTTRDIPSISEKSASARSLELLQQEAVGLRTGQEDLRSSLADVKANLEEVRQQAAHRYASEVERIQDQNEMLFSTWSEALREELEGKQDRVIQQVQGGELAVEIRMRELDTMTAQLSQKFDVCAELSNDITMMKAAIHELQEHIQKGESAWATSTSAMGATGSGKSTPGGKKPLQSNSQSPDKLKGQQTEHAEWKPLHSKTSAKGLPKGNSGAY